MAGKAPARSVVCENCGAPGDVYVPDGLYCAGCALQIQQANSESGVRRRVRWRLPKRWRRLKNEAASWRWLYVAERTAFASIWVLAIMAITGVGGASPRFATSIVMTGVYLVLRAVNDSTDATTSQKVRRGVTFWLVLLAGILVAGVMLGLVIAANRFGLF